MTVAGFTFIRNAILYDYPVVEAINSALPLCDVFVVAVGKSDDNTRQLIENIADPRIIIIDTVWNDTLRDGGKVLAVETDKAYDAIPHNVDWCLYIQADECIHEADHITIKQAMEQYYHDAQTEGLLFKYLHFYGSYDYIGKSRRWYRREVRIIRKNKAIHSYRDAQGFRINRQNVNPAKLQVRLIDAYIHHYGWVKHPDAQQRKQMNFNKLWHGDNAYITQIAPISTEYRYNGTEPLEQFLGTHPMPIQARVKAQNWQFDTDPTQTVFSWKDSISNWVEQWTGWRPFEYKNYKLLK